MKNLKKTLACLLTVAMVAGLSALSASAATEKIEAETGTVNGTAVVVNTGLGADVSGGAWIGSVGADAGSTDNYVELTVNSAAAGQATIVVGYNTAMDRTLDISVNGADPVNVATPASGTSWSEGIATVTAEVTVNAGANTIKLYNATGWAPNVDYIEVTTPDAAAEGGDEGGETTTPPADEQDPPKTGDATMIAVAVAVVALAGVAVVSKKRNSAE